MKRPTTAERIKPLAERPCGFTFRDLPDLDRSTMVGAIKTLMKHKQVFEFRGKQKKGFWFATAAARDAFAATYIAAPFKHLRLGTGKSSPQWDARAKAIVPAGVVIQRAPTPPGRYEVQGPVIGGWASEWATLRGQA